MQIKILKSLLIICALFCLSLLLLTNLTAIGGTLRTGESDTTDSYDTYQRVLDAVFPRSSGNFLKENKDFTLSLRFLPSFGVESQINTTKFNDGKLEVITYKLPKDSQSVSKQIDQLLESDKSISVEEMAKRVKIEKQTVKDTKRVRELLRRYQALRFSPQLDTALTLDGTRFDIWYDSVSNQSYYSLVGGEIGQDKTDHPLVKWMNQVRQIAQNQN